MKSCFILLVLAIISCQSENGNGRIKPRQMDITESVYASVKVKPKTSYYVQPLRSGIVKKIFVEVGDIVYKDQILFQISATADVKSRLTNAELNLKEARSHYKGRHNLSTNIKLEIESVKKQLSLDSLNFKRQERLWAQNVGKKIDYDRAILKYHGTERNLEILQRKYVQSLQNLERNYKRAINLNNTEQNLLKDFTVRSKINGKVFTVNKEVGDFMSPQERFGEIGSQNDFILEMDIDEVDIAKINIGDTVIVILDAYPEGIFTAVTTKVYPKKDEITQTFRVESEFTKVPPKLYNGLSGEANIVISKRKNTLVIPSQYLIDKDKVLTENGEQRIELGLKNLELVEVLSGIDTNTTLIMPEN